MMLRQIATISRTINLFRSHIVHIRWSLPACSRKHACLRYRMSLVVARLCNRRSSGATSRDWDHVLCAIQRQQLRQYIHSHDRCYCCTRGRYRTRVWRHDTAHRPSFITMRIWAVSIFATGADDAAAELASSRNSWRHDRIHSFTTLIGTDIAEGFSDD